MAGSHSIPRITDMMCVQLRQSRSRPARDLRNTSNAWFLKGGGCADRCKNSFLAEQAEYDHKKTSCSLWWEG